MQQYIDRLRLALETSGLFDRDWYLVRYPDVAVSGVDALEHFLRVGTRLGRDPGPRFNTEHYLQSNVDVARSGLNPLMHYLDHGRKEGRQPLPKETATAPGPAGGASTGVAAGTSPAMGRAAIKSATPRPIGGLKNKGNEMRTVNELDAALSDLPRGRNVPAPGAAEVASLQARIARLESLLAERSRDVARLLQSSAQREDEWDAKAVAFAVSSDARIRTLEAKVARAERAAARIVEVEAQLARAEVRVRELEQAFAAATERARQAELGKCIATAMANDAATRRAAPVKSIGGRFMSRLRIVTRGGGADELALNALRVDQSGLFDREWYLATYPDVALAGLDPVKHYLQHGAWEGRDPSRDFSTAEYLHANPDVVAAGKNPLLHYVQHGLDEGRARK